MRKRDDYYDGLIAGGTVAIAVATLLTLLITVFVNNKENSGFHEWINSHCEKENVENTSFKCDDGDGNIYIVKKEA
ncbi:hypothetical protein RRL59_004487 [Escherichia coli]|nr:hypothetical protein [Escherichia coli]